MGISIHKTELANCGSSDQPSRPDPKLIIWLLETSQLLQKMW